MDARQSPEFYRQVSENHCTVGVCRVSNPAGGWLAITNLVGNTHPRGCGCRGCNHVEALAWLAWQMVRSSR